MNINQNTNQNANQNANQNIKPSAGNFQPKISEAEKLKAQLQKMSFAFAERYGSYSNQSDFENLEDLMPFMSASLKSKTQDFIAGKRAQAKRAAIYYGITTKALNGQVEEFSPEIGRAKFKISCQRQEIVGSTANANVYYQDLEISLIKESGIWKVNKVTWL